MNKRNLFEDPLRKLAKTYYWQMIYNKSKEISSIRLFSNDIDLTRIQIIFLHWLEEISNLYIDLAMDKPLISEEVINDDLRSESYLLWKRKNKDKDELTSKNTETSTDKIVFINSSKRK